MEKMALLAPVIGVAMLLLALLMMIFIIDAVDPTALQLYG